LGAVNVALVGVTVRVGETAGRMRLIDRLASLIVLMEIVPLIGTTSVVGVTVTLSVQVALVANAKVGTQVVPGPATTLKGGFDDWVTNWSVSGAPILVTVTDIGVLVAPTTMGGKVAGLIE
jgi:hypothetical protein